MSGVGIKFFVVAQLVQLFDFAFVVATVVVYISSFTDCRGKVVLCFGVSVAALRAAGFAG